MISYIIDIVSSILSFSLLLLVVALLLTIHLFKTLSFTLSEFIMWVEHSIVKKRLKDSAHGSHHPEKRIGILEFLEEFIFKVVNIVEISLNHELLLLLCDGYPFLEFFCVLL